MSSLPPKAFERADKSPDDLFYRQARLVTHIDDAAIKAVTGLYREYLPPGGVILDLMSSWVSHLPREVKYSRVVGLGLNREELSHNERLESFVVQNLNENPNLPFGDGEFDGAGICVSIQYLTGPAAVLRELGRVVKPGGPAVITFSNRCFPTKAVAIWQSLDGPGHLELVKRYLLDAGNWTAIEKLDRSSPRQPFRKSDPLLAVVGRSGGPYRVGGDQAG